MKTFRYLAAGLLWLTGLMHVGQLAVVRSIEVGLIIAVTFGVIYLVLGFLLLRGGRGILWAGAILPLVGLLLAVLGMFMQPTLLGAVFIAIDLGIAACCFALLFGKGTREVSA